MVRHPDGSVTLTAEEADSLWHDLDWIALPFNTWWQRHMDASDLKAEERRKLAEHWKTMLFPAAMSVADVAQVAETLPKCTP